MLVGLLLPAVQQAREAARIMQCNNHLRQMGIAAMNLESSQRTFPSGGWSAPWVGDPDQGLGKNQPGSWLYSLLPFVEQQALWALGQDGVEETNDFQKSSAATRAQTPIGLFYCPSRRPAILYSSKGLSANNMSSIDSCAKHDYAANAGDCYQQIYPSNIVEGKKMDTKGVTYETGVVFIKSGCTLGEIRDGTTNTYLFGEKFINADHYTDSKAEGDDNSAWHGGDNDKLRRTQYDASGSYAPRQDQPGANLAIHFGSVHSGSFGMAMCDASVQRISYRIDPLVHSYLGTKADGHVANWNQP